MNGKKSQKSFFPLHRTKVEVKKEKDSNEPASLFLQCPICFCNVLKMNIESHVEECLQRQSSEEQRDNSRKAAEGSTGTLSMEEKLKETLDDIEDDPIERKPVQMTKKPKKDHGGEWKPLAERVRPMEFDEMSGDQEIIGELSIVRAMLQKDPPPSMILCGPPGCGKTTIATIISQHTRCSYVTLSCCTATVDEIRQVATRAENEFRLRGLPTVLFMDEIHRFNSKQQDIFLPYVEKGTLVLIGATTENPSFSINAALLSRCQIIPLKLLTTEEVCSILRRAIRTDRHLRAIHFTLPPDILEYIALKADGDARSALNILDYCSRCTDEQTITKERIDSLVTEHFIRYDRHGEEHFNIISALHKSIRGSDIQASLYWLTRMLEGGENPLYIARRLIRCSTEDIGLSDPQALLLTTQCYHTCKELGAPLCFSALAQCVAYLTLTCKSNELYLAYGKVADVIHESGAVSVPELLRKTPEYDYTTGRNFLPEGVKDEQFIDVVRATTDLRTPSMNRYLHPGSEDVGRMAVDANLTVLPLEKRMKLDVDM